MANEIQTDKQQKGVLRSLDWWTIAIYVALLSFGWLSVCERATRMETLISSVFPRVRVCRLFGLAHRYVSDLLF